MDGGDRGRVVGLRCAALLVAPALALLVLALLGKPRRSFLPPLVLFRLAPSRRLFLPPQTCAIPACCQSGTARMGKAKPKAAGKAKGADGVPGGAVLAAVLVVAAAAAIGLLFPWGAIEAAALPQQKVAQQKLILTLTTDH